MGEGLPYLRSFFALSRHCNMESRKSKSHTSLFTRVSSTTELLPHTQSLHSKFSLYNAGAGVPSPNQLPTISSRPGSSRPQSRVDLRPMSTRPMSSRPSLTQLEQQYSRPGSRMEASRSPSRSLSRQQSAGPRQRPVSAIRPLSGRVFMRRKEHGWVAKHYPSDHPTSLTNLSDDLEDSDCDSLDSFFDEEFDDREESDKLKDLLSCNTLGVGSKGHKKDWIAGEVGIPKFHCPRCRDHWYGLTPFPCDEELARLIRDGLWHTGMGDSGKFKKSGEWTGGKGGTAEGGSPGGADGDSSGRKPKRILKGDGKSDENGSLELGRGNEGKKNKRKITFKLDDESGNGGNGSDGYKNGSGDDGNGSTNNLTGDQHQNHLSTNSGIDGIDHHLLNGVGSSSLSNSRGNGLNTNNTGLLGSSGFGGNGRKTESFEDNQRTSRTANGLLSDEAGMGLLNSLADSGHLGNSKNRGTSGGKLGVHDGQNDGRGDGSVQQASDTQNDGGVGSLTSSTEGGRKMSDSAGPDYGRKVRKAGGYMRASSPTGSEWGDPSHARLYASSTVASSLTGSTSNLHKDRALPPIIPPIRARKPRADFLEGGFEITPPWRYSYFSPSPLHTAAARQTATTTPRKKKKK